MKTKIKDERYHLICDNGLNNTIDYEVMEYEPAEKELHINGYGGYIYLTTNIHIGHYIRKFVPWIKVETVNSEGKINSITAKIPVDEVVITRSPNRDHLKKKTE